MTTTSATRSEQSLLHACTAQPSCALVRWDALLLIPVVLRLASSALSNSYLTVYGLEIAALHQHFRLFKPAVECHACPTASFTILCISHSIRADTSHTDECCDTCSWAWRRL